jgi:Mrp family chromosome partitioning ATPase/capsular polysaccharide biosynthesis protein
MATVSSGSPALPATPPPAAPAQAAAAAPSGGMSVNPLASLRKHPRVALAVACAVAVLGLPLAWVMGKPKYEATAAIYVSPRFMANLDNSENSKFDSTTQYREYVTQNAKTINRFDIMVDALKTPGGAASGWIKPKETLEHAASRLQGALAIEEVPDTYQITVSLAGEKKTGLAELVNAVAEIYIEKAKSEEFYGSDQSVESLTQDRARLQKAIADKQARRLALAQELGVSSFSDNDENPYDRLLVTAKEAEAEAQKEAIQAEGQLAVFDDQQRRGGAEALRAAAMTEAVKDPALASLMTNFNSRRAAVLASVSGLSAEHPGRRAAQRELAEIDQETQAATEKVVQSFSKTILDQRAAEAYEARHVEQKLAAEVDRQAAQASWFTRGYQEGIQLGNEIDEARKTEETIRQRIDYISLEKRAPGFVRLFSAARPPDEPIKGGRKKLMGIFLFLALALGLVVPTGIDFLDPRLHAPAQAEGILGLPLVAWLMEKPEAGPGFEREQILRLANRLNQDRQNHGSRIFAFTSVKAAGGSSTIVLETARSLTRLGVPAIAVEANAYHSDPRYASANSRGPASRGLAAILTGSGQLHQEVVPGDEDRPDRVPVGEVGGAAKGAANEPGNGAGNLPETQNLAPVLRQAAETYSVVLVDAPPILASVDAEILACAADVVILVIEAGSVTKGELRRAAKILERLNIRAISALLNRVRRDEPTGLATVALEEFRTGSAPPSPRLLSPWLWR